MTDIAAAVPAAVPVASAPELGFTHFIAQTDLVGQGLFVILVVMSLISWALIVIKGVGLFRRQQFLGQHCFRGGHQIPSC